MKFFSNWTNTKKKKMRKAKVLIITFFVYFHANNKTFSMKTFLKDNWYKLMIGSSMMMASFGFMIYAISPAYSNNNDHKVEIQTPQSSNAPVGTNGVIVGDYAYFVDGGYVYEWDRGSSWNSSYNWSKYKLP